jgi:hypothetical protein
MRILAALIVTGPLMLLAALPAAGQSKSTDTPAQVTVDGNSTAEKDTYTQKVRDELRDWQQKLDAFGEKAKANGQRVDDAAEHDLREAWIKTQAEGAKLQTAAAEGWADAKASFEKADRELADAWDKVRPQDKSNGTAGAVRTPSASK